MHADIPLEDQTHENFWQQLLRWLVDGVPEYVSARPESEEVEVGEAVRIIAEVNDSAYLEVNDARVRATLTAPDGSMEMLPLEWTVETDGEYAGTFTPAMEGEYEFSLSAEKGEDLSLGTDQAYLRVGPSSQEYFDAGLRRGFLTRLAEETGGRYYDPSDVGTLPEDVRITGAGVTLTEEKDLWDMPVLFLLLIALVGTEWAFRRMRGLV
jgi:hypothetical protein